MDFLLIMEKEIVIKTFKKCLKKYFQMKTYVLLNQYNEQIKYIYQLKHKTGSGNSSIQKLKFHYMIVIPFN